MKVVVSIDSDLATILGSLDLKQKSIKKALKSAIRSTAKNVQAQGKKIARMRYTSFDPKTLKVIQRFNFSQHDTLEGEVRFNGKRGAGLRNFLPSPKMPRNGRRKWEKPPEGVTSLILRGGIRKVYTGPDGEKPFWAKAKQGFMALFYRKKSIVWQYGTIHKGKRVGGGLKMLFGPSAIQALGHVSIDELTRITQDALSKNVDRTLRAAMKGYLK